MLIGRFCGIETRRIDGGRGKTYEVCRCKNEETIFGSKLRELEGIVKGIRQKKPVFGILRAAILAYRDVLYL